MSLPLKDIPQNPDTLTENSDMDGSAPPVNPNEDKKIVYGVIALALVIVVVLVWRFFKRHKEQKEEDET